MGEASIPCIAPEAGWRGISSSTCQVSQNHLTTHLSPSWVNLPWLSYAQLHATVQHRLCRVHNQGRQSTIWHRAGMGWQWPLLALTKAPPQKPPPSLTAASPPHLTALPPTLRAILWGLWHCRVLPQQGGSRGGGVQWFALRDKENLPQRQVRERSPLVAVRFPATALLHSTTLAMVLPQPGEKTWSEDTGDPIPGQSLGEQWQPLWALPQVALQRPPEIPDSSHSATAHP